eukprot:GHRR01027480.1.p1 GENE.GHRR01027480.1~~GHRR01027480.1.p1  ORF type:complete len:361 (+),score=132.96 GHRR01027480.1:358-1440(+)
MFRSQLTGMPRCYCWALQVQQHLDRMQQQKEAVAMDKLNLLMPQIGDMARAVALAKSDWDIDNAVNMLRSFQVAHLDKLNTLNKKRKKLREEMEACHNPEEDKPSGSGREADNSSGSGSSSGGNKNSSEDHKRKRKRSDRSDSKKRKRLPSDRKTKKKHRVEKRKKDSKKRKQRDSSDKQDVGKAQRKLTHSQDFGKYGYIRDADQHAKHNEFQLWAIDVKGVNVELLGKQEEKQLFRDYMEDFNTGTLPHKKYYDLDAYERGQAAKAARERSGAGGEADALFNARADEEQLRGQRIEERRKQQQDRLNEAYNLLKHTDRAKDMREQELLRAEMALAYKTGDTAKAQKLYERLLPDDQKK